MSVLIQWKGVCYLSHTLGDNEMMQITSPYTASNQDRGKNQLISHKMTNDHNLNKEEGVKDRMYHFDR